MDSAISSKINLLEVFSDLKYRGGQRNMVSFAKYFRKDIFNVFVGAYDSGGPLENVLVGLKIPFVVANRNLENLFKLIQKENISIIHIHRSGGEIKIETELIIGAKKINPNLIVIEKNVFGKFDPSLERNIDCSFFQSMMHLNERYLPNSGLGFDFNKMKVLNNIVDSEEFVGYTATKSEIFDFKSKLGIDQNDYVVGKIAHPAIEKWSDLILDMMPYLLEKISNVKIVVIGTPESRVKRIMNGKYRKNFVLINQTNEQKKLHLFYQSIDVLAHCSKIGECNVNTINEAMFWKKPVVVNSTPRKDNGQLEQVINEENGLIANRPATFARAIVYLLQNKNVADQFGDAGFKQVSTLYNARFVVSQVEKFLIEKLKQRNLLVNSENIERCKSINYYPSEKDIINYRTEYKRRLKIDFGKLSITETIVYWCCLPKRFYFKVMDYIQHKFRIYDGH